MLNGIPVVLVAVLIVLAIVGLLLPRNAHIERSISIARPASLIYAAVNMFERTDTSADTSMIRTELYAPIQ
jgi:hypothetical protein